VVPLSLRGVMQSVAFVRDGDHLASTSVVPCGFMPLQGELAGRDPVRPIGDVAGVFLRLEDDHDHDLAALHAALRQPAQAMSTGVTITDSYLFAGLGLWLVLHDPDVGELTAVGAAATRGLIPAVTSRSSNWASTMVLAGQASLAAIARPAGAEQADTFEACVRGYGPDGERLAERLAAGIRGWEFAGRPGSWTLRVRAYPASAADREDAGFTIATPHTRFLLDW
jgi:protein-L-isoaspartate(D-aspartate) O-methyltransferase